MRTGGEREDYHNYKTRVKRRWGKDYNKLLEKKNLKIKTNLINDFIKKKKARAKEECGKNNLIVCLKKRNTNKDLYPDFA